MAYIKISDPDIIDIAAFQQIVNVINQHSDNITALTNNFNGIGSQNTDWTAANWSHIWDPGSQALVYGKIQADTSTASFVGSSPKTYYGSGSFSDATISSTFQFSSIPVVTATLYSGHSAAGTVSTVNGQCNISIYDITTSGFKWRISSNSTTSPTGIFYIMWTAAGPR